MIKHYPYHYNEIHDVQSYIITIFYIVMTLQQSGAYTKPSVKDINFQFKNQFT
jgi:hypothetical protein